jgi:hypothetical protein
MTSLRQIESNRRNAQKSTGPKTDDGKRRASRNAVRHGLTAETVIRLLEDPDDYQVFESAVTADYDAETAVERELVLRLASLLWRLRRATSIETGLLQRQGEILRERGETQQPQRHSRDCAALSALRLGQAAAVESDDLWSESDDNCVTVDGRSGSDPTPDPQLEVARCFLRLAKLDNGAFERLGRYESALWRQAKQTLLTLERLRWRISGNHHSRRQQWWRGTIRHPPEEKW